MTDTFHLFRQLACSDMVRTARGSNISLPQTIIG